jgi:hypothetical protein
LSAKPVLGEKPDRALQNLVGALARREPLARF